KTARRLSGLLALAALRGSITCASCGSDNISHKKLSGNDVDGWDPMWVYMPLPRPRQNAKPPKFWGRIMAPPSRSSRRIGRKRDNSSAQHFSYSIPQVSAPTQGLAVTLRLLARTPATSVARARGGSPALLGCGRGPGREGHEGLRAPARRRSPQ